jgi:3-hydroxyacyl-CoA dehydrogenase
MDGDVAVVTIDNPPVNALKHEVRAGLTEAFRRIRTDDRIRSVVLACAGRTFVAGADITEFGKPPKPPSLREVLPEIEGLGKPVVAAIHGTALGGGLELALACHYRVAVPSARLGLPEVKLGILPGAGGTQLLPRAVGPDEALRMIVTGEMIPAKRAHELGLIDSIADEDLTAEAIAFARAKADDGGPFRQLRADDSKLADARRDRTAFNELAGNLLKRARGLHAPVACVEAVKAALDMAVDEGLKHERKLFEQLVSGDQSKAQRYIFFAERDASKVGDIPADIRPREVASAAVIGGGTMGGGIAMCFANAGIPVVIVETTAEALERGLGIIKKNYASTVAKRSLKQEEMDRRMGLITGTTDYADIAQADIIIEAVFEDMAIKQEVFAKVDRIAKPEAVLATNTSYQDVNKIAQATQRPSSVLGMHFFSPANIMRLLEIVRGEQTAPDVLATALAVGRKIGKVTAVVGVCYGFVGNRMLRARAIEAERLLLEGALPQQVDGALTEFGFPMGPFAMGDLAGLDVGWRARKAQGVRAEIADALCEAGRFGQKTGKGFYRYEGSRTPQPDPEVEKLILDTSKRLQIERRSIGNEEIIERLIFPMINEGAHILDEGIAQRASDIDVIWVYGYGWPVWRGGPMFYADQIGLSHVRDRLKHYAQISNDKRLQPAPLLDRLADSGATFASLGGSLKKVA